MITSAPDGDLIKLYSTKILALASDIPHLGRLEAPQASVNLRAPVCGSSVTVDIIAQNGRIASFAQDVKACALGQASAAIAGAHVVGRTLPEVRLAQSQLARMLAEQGPVPDVPFEGFEVLRAAIGFQNRHASILLAISATRDALEAALEGCRA